MQNKTIFIVSDLHMGDGGPRDNLAADDKAGQFSRFLDYVQQKDGRLFILGDLFEFWQANVGKVIKQRLDFLDRFAKMNAAYVVGNHDADIEEFIDSNLLNHPFFRNMTGPFEMTIGDKRFKFMHGHELDPFNRESTPRWGRILAILCGIIEDRKGSPLLSAGGFTEKTLLRAGRAFMWTWNNSVNWLEKSAVHEKTHSVEESLTPAQNPARLKGIMALYQRDRLKNGYDVLITGHTHAAGKTDNWYCNSGCWVGLRNNFLTIEPDGAVAVWEWKNNTACRWPKQDKMGIRT